MKTFIPDNLYNYVLGHNIPNLDKLVQDRITYTNTLHNAHLLTSVDQVNFIGEIASIVNCARYLEVGVFTGVTCLNVALHIPMSEIFLIDNNQKYLNDIELIFEQNKLPNLLHTFAGDGVLLLEQILLEHLGVFDLIYIDAKKTDYINYYNLAKKLIRLNGIILIDNVLMYGDVLEQNPAKKYVETIKELNQIISNDKEVSSVMLSLGDGLRMVRRII